MTLQTNLTAAAPTEHSASMPLTGQASRWPKVSWIIALAGQFLFVFTVLILSNPGRIDIVDGQTRYEVARSLVEHGDFIVRDDKVWFTVFEGRDGQRYSNYRFPQSGIGVLAILAADATGGVSEERRHFFFTCISPLAGALLALTYSVWFRSLGCTPRASLAWATAGIFCTPNWFYSTSTVDDMLGTCTIVLAVAVAWMWRDKHPLRGAAVVGLLMAWAINCKPPLGLFVLPVLAAGYRPGEPLRRQLAPLALVLSGIVLGLVTYQMFESYKFPAGTPDHELLYGAVWTANPIPALANFALGPSAGVMWYCPTVLLSYWGWRRWRPAQALFCWATLTACGLFLLFISFLVFFKGGPFWGPRYLTPLFALGWVFVPAAAKVLRQFVVGAILASGLVIQLLGLSIDPHRMFLEGPVPFLYHTANPWLGLHPSTSNLLQRPREIVKAWRTWDEPSPRFGLADVPTHAGGFMAPQVCNAATIVGLMAAPQELGSPIAVMWDWEVGAPMRTEVIYQGSVHHFQIFNSFRPWWISEWYLPEEQRPVDLARTIVLLSILSAFGLGSMIVAGRSQKNATFA
jgi:hypothetical protein